MTEKFILTEKSFCWVKNFLAEEFGRKKSLAEQVFVLKNFGGKNLTKNLWPKKIGRKHLTKYLWQKKIDQQNRFGRKLTIS